jgi:hypothetical protein
MAMTGQVARSIHVGRQDKWIGAPGASTKKMSAIDRDGSPLVRIRPTC